MLPSKRVLNRVVALEGSSTLATTVREHLEEILYEDHPFKSFVILQNILSPIKREDQVYSTLVDLVIIELDELDPKIYFIRTTGKDKNIYNVMYELENIKVLRVANYYYAVCLDTEISEYVEEILRKRNIGLFVIDSGTNKIEHKITPKYEERTFPLILGKGEIDKIRQECHRKYSNYEICEDIINKIIMKDEV